MAGRGSAERSRAARPRWVMMEISRVARASTAERFGQNSFKIQECSLEISKISEIIFSTFFKISAKFRENFIKISAKLDEKC